MDQTERDAFLRAPHTAVLATIDSRGRAHAVPVWYRWHEGAFRILTDRGSQKHRNVERTGRATLCIDERDSGFRYVTAEGSVTVEPVTRDERLALHLVYRSPEQARQVVERGGHERMVCLVLTPERWVG